MLVAIHSSGRPQQDFCSVFSPFAEEEEQLSSREGTCIGGKRRPQQGTHRSRQVQRSEGPPPGLLREVVRGQALPRGDDQGQADAVEGPHHIPLGQGGAPRKQGRHQAPEAHPKRQDVDAVEVVPCVQDLAGQSLSFMPDSDKNGELGSGQHLAAGTLFFTLRILIVVRATRVVTK